MATAADEVKDSNSNAQSPPLPAATDNQRLTAQEAANLAGDSGTNAPIKTLVQTQSVPDDSNADPGVITEPYYAPGTGAETADPAAGRAAPAGTPGTGSSAEEAEGAANTRQILANFNKKVFLPKNNVLDQYASYTYNIGWYLMSPANYKELLKTKKPNIANYSLLAQSGGAAASKPGANTGGVRNQFFGIDYYIDDLEITSVVSGKGGKRAHNSSEITFKVTEPAGITLINNIQKAVASVYKNDMKYGLAVFCLVIRFYGYDENGKIVSAANSENKDAIVEKFIPFFISNVSFRIANKIVEYEVKATPVVYHVGFGTQYGTIKAPIEITGSTVNQILNGNGTDNNSVSADDGRTTQSALQGSSDFYG